MKMPAIFSKNCILTGDLDSYCLACSIHLLREEDVLAHIQEENHTDNINLLTYHEKFKDDMIKKVNGVYLCEVCNKTFSTAAKVGIHVTEDTHVKERRRRVRRVANSVLIENTLIEERAWNGLVQDTCVLCNADFEDLSAHVADHNHVLNVIKSSVIVDSDNNVYRKVEGGYHCLTCNEVMADSSIERHLTSTAHKNGFTKYISNNDDTNKQIKSNILKDKMASDSDVKSKEITPTLENNQCSSSAVDTNDVKKNPEKTASLDSTNEDIEKLAKRNGLFVNKCNNTVHCNICIVQVPATMNCVQEHVTGKKHKDNIQKQPIPLQHNKINIKKVLLSNFVTTLHRIETSDGIYILINNKFLLEFMNFIGLRFHSGRIICLFCHIDIINKNDIVTHLRTAQHENLIDNSYIITMLQNEFVRQIKYDLYHCGYCGIVENDYDDMLEHLCTIEHATERKSMEQLLKFVEFNDRLHEDRIRRHVNSFLNRFDFFNI